MSSNLLLVGLIALPFIAPLWIGVHLARTGAGNPLRQFAGWLTLKPLVATPLWMLVVSAFGSAMDELYPLYALLATGVALGLTAAIVWRFRNLVGQWLTGQYSGNAIWILLLLDTVRWSNSIFIALLVVPTGGLNILLALALPTIFAIVAAVICRDA